MINQTDTHATITCDKCGEQSTDEKPTHNDVWHLLGWIANFGAKKYVHLCSKCRSIRKK